MASPARSIATLLFDWDGTLVDSALLGLAAFRKTFAELGIEFSDEIYEAAYSPNWYSIYQALGLPQPQWQRADSLWMKHYGLQPAEPVRHAKETISELHQRGYCLGVVSSGTESRVLREIEHAGLSGKFQVVVCNEHIVQKKPHPEGLEIALQKLGCAKDECGYVGDAPEDIEMGKRAKVLTIGVKSSYPTSVRLMAADPDIYIGSVEQLLDHFPALLANRE